MHYTKIGVFQEFQEEAFLSYIWDTVSSSASTHVSLKHATPLLATGTKKSVVRNYGNM